MGEACAVRALGEAAGEVCAVCAAAGGLVGRGARCWASSGLASDESMVGLSVSVGGEFFCR